MKHVSCADTAKLVRKALKKEFPGIKFSVRSKTYSGGASITARWTDGPTREEVDKVTGQFAGAEFDGMVDCKYYSVHWLMPDGTVTIARSSGAHGYDAETFDAPHPDAERVSFGADFIFAERTQSREFTERFGRWYAAETGWDMPEVYDTGGFAVNWQKKAPNDHYPLADRFNRKLRATSESELERLEQSRPTESLDDDVIADQAEDWAVDHDDQGVDWDGYFVTCSWDAEVEVVSV